MIHIYKSSKLLILLLIAVFTGTLSPEVFSQVRNCFEAEHFCDFDGFDDRENVQLPPVYTSFNCKGEEIVNPLWYAFTAGEGDLTIIGTKTECPPNTIASPGIIITVWEFCPGLVNECVATTTCPQGGLGNPFVVELEIPEGNLVPGGIYYVSVSGCSGEECQYQLDFVGEELQLPDLDDPGSKLTVEGCMGGLPPFTYCEGNEITIKADGDHFDDIMGEWEWNIRELDMSANANSVTWSGNYHSGTGNPIINGGLYKFNLGANGLTLNFPDIGKYEICLEKIGTNCGLAPGGPLCQEITIIPPPDLQEFPRYDICFSTLFNGGSWAGPPVPNAEGQNWVAGFITLDDLLDAEQDDDDNYIVRKTSPPDRCGCSYEQEVLINLVGDSDPEEIELELMECQLPYQWFDLTIFELDDYIFPTQIILDQASLEKNYEGVPCDSFVVLTVVEMELDAQVIETGCTDMGKEFTFVLEGTELQGADFQWIDDNTGLDATPISENPSAVLPTGSYRVFVSGYIEDVNHNPGSQGTSPLSFIQCEFGPFEINNPVPMIPEVMPYDTFLCPDEQLNVVFQIDTLADTLDVFYNWLLPLSITGQESYNPDSSVITIADISGILLTDTIRVYASVDCGVSDTLDLPVVLSEDPMAPDFPARIECSTVPFTISYEYVPGYLYTWDFGGGHAIGNTNDGSDFQLVYEAAGIYNYNLTIETPDGCVTEAGPFVVEVFDLPPNPVVSCNDREHTTSLSFTWDEIPGLEYEVMVNTPDVTGMRQGNTYTFDDLQPGKTVSITVSATNNGPVECNTSSTELSCRTSPCDAPPIDVGNFVDQAFCEDATGEFQYSVSLPPGYSFSYSGPGIDNNGLLNLESPDLEEPGDYMILFEFVENATGCTDSRQAMVTIQEDISIDMPVSAILCHGGSETIVPQVSGGIGDYLYEWSDGSRELEIEIPLTGNESPGTYEIVLNVNDDGSVCSESATLEYIVLEEVPVITELIYNCNTNGTELDLSDDYYDVFINAIWTDPDSAGVFSVSSGGEALGIFNYGTGGSFQLDADSSVAAIVVTDLSFQMCVTDTVAGPLLPCEPDCEIQTSSVVLCNDNDTSTPEDDFYDVRVVVFVTNPGPSGMFRLTANGEELGTYSYMDGAVFQSPAIGEVDLYLEDIDKPECNVSSSVNLVPCSFPQFECDASAFKGIPLYGPFSSITLSNPNFVKEAQSFENGPGEKITSLSLYAAGELFKTNCHSDSAEYIVEFYEDNQGLPGTLMERFIVRTAPDSVGKWSQNNKMYTIYDYTFELNQVFTAENGWLSVEPAEDNCTFIWLSGDNAPNVGGAVRDTIGNWRARGSLNYCFYYDPVSSEETVFDKVRIYPVPSSGIVYAEHLDKISALSIYNIHGQELLNKQVESQNMTLNISGWAPGMYVLLLKDSEGRTRTFRLVHQP